MENLKNKVHRQLDRIKNMMRESGKNPIILLWHIVRLQYKRRFYLTEIHDYELDKRGEEYEKSFLNWEEQKKYLELLNPRKYYSLARNKYVTHLILEYAGIKNKPTLLCYYNPEFGLGSDRIGTDLKQVIQILKKKGLESFVVKTTESSHGDNVWVIKKIVFQNDDALLQRFDEEQIKLSDLLKKEPLIFESVINQTRQMSKLNESSVNTVRFMTVLLPEGNAKTIAAFMKIGRAGSCVDNAGSGGNVDAAVDVKTGRLYNAMEFNGWRNTRYITNHPDSKAVIEGMVIKNWDSVKNEVENFQRCLPYVKAAGWDIAITPDGPIIIEVNDMWDRTGQFFIGRGWKQEIEECYNAWKEYYNK